MPGKWFSLPPQIWLMVLLGSVLVGILIPRHREEGPDVALIRSLEHGGHLVPTPGADPPERGGIVLRTDSEPPLRVTLDGVPWEIRQVYYSHNDNQFEPMIRHAQCLGGHYFASEATPLPKIASVPHLRLTVRMDSKNAGLGLYQLQRLLVQDEQGFWHPPITCGAERRNGEDFEAGLTYFLPSATRPAALGWRAGRTGESLNMFYQGAAYFPEFAKSGGELYVNVYAESKDVGWLGNNVDRKATLHSEGERFYLAGVDMHEWTERHQKDWGFGNTKVLLRFPQREAPRKAATSSAQ